MLGCIVAARITIVYISSLEVSEASPGTVLICLQHFATSSMKKYIPVPVDIGPVSLPAVPKLIDTYLQDLHRLFQVKSIWGRKRLRSPRIIIGSPMTVRLVSLCSYYRFIICRREIISTCSDFKHQNTSWVGIEAYPSCQAHVS